MNIIFVFTLLLSFIQPVSDSSLVEQSKRQAVFYIQQVNKETGTDAYLWAFTTLYQSKPKLQTFIQDEIKTRGYKQDYYNPFISDQVNKQSLLHEVVFATGSPSLFIELLLKEQNADSRQQLKQKFLQQFKLPVKDGVRYEDLANSIIQGTNIDSTLLPNDIFRLPHLFLMMDRYGVRLLSKTYYESILHNWNSLLGKAQSDSLRYALMRASYFRILYLLDKYDETKEFYTFLTEDRLIPNSDVKYILFRNLDYSMFRMGYYDLALEASRNHAIPLTKYLGSKKNELGTLIAQAAYLHKIGKIKEAQETNLKILRDAKLHDVKIPQSSLQNNLGLTYKESGEFDKYLDLQLKALEEANNSENYTHQLTILRNLYLYYLESHDKKAALLYLNEARALAKQEEHTEHLGRVNTYLGMFYRDFENNFEKAQNYFDLAKSKLDKSNNFNFYIEVLLEEVKIYEELEKYGLALQKYEEIAKLSESKDQRRYLEANLDKINIYLKIDSLEIAKSLLDRVKSYDLSQLYFENIIKTKKIEAEYLVRTGKPDIAYDILDPAINQVVEWAQNSSDVQTGFWDIDKEFLDIFELTADLLIDTGREEEAVEVLDRLKTINDASLYQNPMVKSSLLDETELTQYQRLTGQLDALRKQQLLASDKQKVSLQSRIDQLSAKKRMLDRKISDMADQKPISLDEVQRQLAGREMVLHITELNDWYYIAKVSRSEVSFNKIRLDSTLRGQFTNAIERLSRGETNINELGRIYEVLDLAGLPSWINTLTIIPDSYLYQLPIDILPLNNDGYGYSYGGATYMVERFKTHYLTSLNEFRGTKKGSREYDWDFVGYGVSEFPAYTSQKNLVPLPHATSEVSEIVSNLTNVSSKTAFLDSSGSERTFKQTAPNARIIHLATHSELSDRDPLFSTLYMSREGAEDEENFSGQIFAYELFELNLSNDLIMLNSCESGSGPYLQGAGVMGISRALRYAGANSLILNLWSVNDMMASDFAVEFYKNINKGQSKDEALRQTKLHFLKNKNANPHYWGPYMLIGDREPLVRPYRETNIYFAASFMLLFVTVASFSLIKEWKKKAA